MTTKQSKSRPRYWRASIAAAYDIARLSDKFETRQQVEDRSKNLQDRLENRLGLAKLASALFDCRGVDDPCGKPFCPKCGRQLRRYQFQRVHRLWKSNKANAIVMTVYLAEFYQGILQAADVDQLHRAFRRRLDLAGFAGSIVIGGTEAGYNYNEGTWTVHLHLLIVGASKEAIKNLRNATKKLKESRGVKVDAIRDPVRQLSYLQKFETGHRPSLRTGEKRPRMVPMPDATLKEYVLWLNKYQLQDFCFSYGLGRHGI